MFQILLLAFVLLVTCIAGGVTFYWLSTPEVIMSVKRDIESILAKYSRTWKLMLRHGSELGGYVHDTAMSKFVPPTVMMGITGTFTFAAGAVAGTIALHRAAAAQTSVVYIPIDIPANSVALKGSLLKSIEIDYENLLATATSVTFALTKITRGADTAVAVVSTVTTTQDLVAATTAAKQDQCKCTVTVTTPEWVSNSTNYVLTMTIVAAGTITNDVLGATVNYTARL